jgi:hypothetical protein
MKRLSHANFTAVPTGLLTPLYRVVIHVHSLLQNITCYWSTKHQSGCHIFAMLAVLDAATSLFLPSTRIRVCANTCMLYHCVQCIQHKDPDGLDCQDVQNHFTNKRLAVGTVRTNIVLCDCLHIADWQCCNSLHS